MRFFVLISFLVWAQLAVTQTAPVITYESYMKMVQQHHPLARVADIRVESADAMLQSARGAFDPKIQGGLSRKDFDGKRYYDLLQGGIEIPTWLGVKLQGGYSQNEGVFLNPERLTPDQGLLQAGLRLSLGEGLFIDERRAGLRTAELAQDMAAAERVMLLNDLLLEAGYAYWNWFAAYNAADVYGEALQLAQDRFVAVKQSADLGDRPTIDTLEASIQFQARSLQLQEAILKRQNAAARLSVYLWLEGELPMIVNPESVPPSADEYRAIPADPLLMVELDEQVAAHPFLNAQALDIERTEIDQRWKREQLKPQVDFKYNALRESLSGTETAGFNANDFTLGIAVSMPILLRKERGALELTNLKIEEKQLGLAVKRQDIWLKARMAVNDWDLTAQQVQLFEGTARDYGSLLEGERELFRQGESSLFLVNSRESKYVNAQVKLIELKAKNKLAELRTRFALANLDQEL